MDSNINQEICTKCKLCIEVCPCNILGTNETAEVYFKPERKSICLNCGQCMAVCGSKAITVNGLSYANDFIDLPENNIDYNKFVDFLANRRSIRNFKDKPIPNHIIDKILDSISYAPYGAEPNKMNITVVNDRKKIESVLPHLEKFLDNIVKWIENPVVYYMIKRRNDPEKFNTLINHLYPMAKLGNYKLEFGDRITRNAPALIIFHAKRDAESHTDNSLIYATYTMLAAHSIGLGATMIGIVPNAINKVKEVRDIFLIPDENEAVMSVIIGYPKFKYKRTIKRKNKNIQWID
ncbi:MAG: nitroreductase family protein [Clostridiaceae bacterium]|nr:nitroreductase family protein [Clostridiaceae bacterium]